MKSILKRLAVTVIVLCLMFTGSQVFAEDGFVIDSYDTKIDVGEDNRFQVTEKITADFSVPKHGIIRYIPVRGTVRRTDGSRDTMKAKVKGLDVEGENYSTSRDGNYYVVKIGDADRTITGKKNYVINYVYDIGEDLRPNEDEFYFNIIGDKWTTSISDVTFTVNMPKKFDKGKIGFAVTNESEQTIPDVIQYSVEGNTISGKCLRQLKAREGITMRVTLPEGYFTRKTSVFVKLLYLIISVLAGAASFITFMISGRDEKAVKTVELYPPDGMNPTMCELYFREGITTKGITSLIVHMANKGYLSIRDSKKKKDMEFVLEKPYDGNAEEEHKLYNAIFSRAKKGPDGKESVSIGDLEYRLDGVYSQIMDMYSAKKDAILKPSSVSNKAVFMTAMSVCACIAVTSLFMLSDIGIIAGAFFGIPCAILVALFSALIGEKGVIKKILSVLIAIAVFTMFMFAAYAAEANTVYAMISYFMIMIGAFFASFMQAKTHEAVEVLGKVLGFREFLKTAEKDRIRQMAEEDPQYFYDVMPYTYALDVDSTWMKKLKGIEIAPPDWYSGRDDMYYWMMYDRMDRMNRGMSAAASPEPDLDSGGFGGFSGGGGSISGGGFGGGGGSSW